MNYVVVDLEWNQAMSAKSPVFNYLPIHLRGEIIQIGAVRLNEDFTPGDEFQIDIRPVYFRKIHYKVQKLTGFSAERMNAGEGFPEAMEKFRAWCGDDVTFLTWGYDDKGIMEQNIIIHDLDWDWIHAWINLQVIYNRQVISEDHNQKALHTAMEHFGIEQTRVAHDALGDAYNTALVCSHMDMAEGLASYDHVNRALSSGVSEKEGSSPASVPLEHVSFGGYASRNEASADEKVNLVPCPDCGREMAIKRPVSQGAGRYMSIVKCREHGDFLIRLRYRHDDAGEWFVNRIAYRADEKNIEYYRSKLKNSGRRSTRKKKRSAAPDMDTNE